MLLLPFTYDKMCLRNSLFYPLDELLGEKYNRFFFVACFNIQLPLFGIICSHAVSSDFYVWCHSLLHEQHILAVLTALLHGSGDVQSVADRAGPVSTKTGRPSTRAAGAAVENSAPCPRSRNRNRVAVTAAPW